MAISVRNTVAGLPSEGANILYQNNHPLDHLSISASATTVLTYTLPGGTMGINDSLRITTLWTFLNNANAKYAFIGFGGATGADALLNENIASSGLVMRTQQQVSNQNSLSAQIAANESLEVGFGKTSGAYQDFTQDTSADVDIVFRITSDGTDTVNLESVLIELIKAP